MMFGKLLKYEFRHILRLFTPMWAALLVFAGLNRFLLLSDTMNEFLYGIPATLLRICYTVALIAIPVVAIVFLIRRFYIGLLKDEGYLMFTIPVTPAQLIWSKLLSALVLTTLTSLISVLAVFILVYTEDLRNQLNMNYWGFLFDEDVTGGFLSTRICVFAAVSMLLSSACTILQAYLSMSLGQLCKEHRLLASFGFYLGINMVLSIFGTFVMTGIFSSSVDSLSEYFDSLNEMVTLSAGHVNLLFWVGIAYVFLISVFKIALFYFPTNAILKKRLNLE